MSLPTANPRDVFDRYGLGTPGFWGGGGLADDEAGSDSIAAGLCDALEQLGGLYAAFAHFLTWRADLLDATYLARLRRVRLHLPLVQPATVQSILRSELGAAGDELAGAMSGFPEWNTLFRTAYPSTYQGVPVIVEVARDPVSDRDFEDFHLGVRSLRRPELAGVVSPAVMAQFGEWMRNGASLARQRSFLEVLGNYNGDMLAGYPRLIPELCTPGVLCWIAAQGQPVKERVASGDADIVIAIAAAILEQFFSLSMVDADLELDAMVVDADNRLHFRRLHNPIAVLPGIINTGIKYVSAVLAGNSPLAAQMMIRMIVSKPPLDLEKELTDEFSGVEPELKINRWFPASAGAFESNWRALSTIVRQRPMFLDFLHRNLVACGYWNSDAVRAGAAEIDAIAEAQAPVVGRLVRTQFGLLLNRESAKEWAFGTGLLMFGTFRELNRLVEEMRENDFTVGVDVGDWRGGAGANGEGRQVYQYVLGGLLLVFLLALQLGGVASAPWSWVLQVAAVCAAGGMFWAISRIP